jgi:hypothetical protein
MNLLNTRVVAFIRKRPEFKTLNAYFSPHADIVLDARVPLSAINALASTAGLVPDHPQGEILPAAVAYPWSGHRS